MPKKAQLFFDTVKESREGYFVEYSPPGGNMLFASLALVFHQGATRKQVAELMEKEARAWIRRYPIAVMVSAWDEKGDGIELSTEWRKNNLIAWPRPDGYLEMRWELVRDEELPTDALLTEHLLAVYGDLDSRAAEEVRKNADANACQRAKELGIGFSIIFGWAVVVPAGIAFLGWASPAVGVLVLLYALGKAGRQGALMLGWLRSTEQEKAKREKDRLMQHYYYHCERNPDGFRRIVSENFEQDERERIRQEAQELTKP